MTGLLAAGTIQSVLLRLKRGRSPPHSTRPHTHTHTPPAVTLTLLPASPLQLQLNHEGARRATQPRRWACAPSAYLQHIRPDGKLLHLPVCIGFISRSSGDGFSIFLFCVVVAHCREKPHVKTVASSVTRRLTPFARCHFMISLLPASRASPWHGGPFNSDKSLFRQYRKGGGGVLYSNQTVLTPPTPFNSLTFCPPFFLCLLFLHLSLPIARLRANCHLRAPAPNGKGGGGRVGCGRGEVAGIMTEAG